MSSYSLVPFAGRDYSSRAKALRAFDQNLFWYNMSYGEPGNRTITKSNIAEAGGGVVSLRYGKLRKQTIVMVDDSKEE